MKTLSFLSILITLTLSSLTGCGKDKHKMAVLKELFKTYENGKISECKLNGKTVFTGTYNAYDTPIMVYDEDGKEIGACNYAWGTPDELCHDLSQCSNVYCVENNIWGEPAVDKYDLKP